MLILISPAKSLDFDTKPCTDTYTQPAFLEASEQLIRKLRTVSRKRLTEMMGISKALAQLNYERYLAWHPEFSLENAKQAVLAFKGDVYVGMNADGFSDDDFSYAQDHLRILSGLYGVLRPLDLIQPYRLEMGTRLPVRRKKNLYDFWGTRITDFLNADLAERDQKVVFNLASNEYFHAVKPELLDARLINCSFLDLKNGEYKMVSFWAKKARGMMSAYIIQHRLTDPEDAKAFDSAGYVFNEKMSSADDWVFTRDTPEA